MKMYALNQTFETKDLGKALATQQGVFEAVSPTGEKLTVLCQAGGSIHSVISPENPGNWRVTKIAELPETQARAAGTGR